jgi:cytochrome c oxidase subunit 2
LGLAGPAAANTSNGYNLPIGVTGLSRDIYALHMEVFWICVAIAIVVFGVMIYALVKFRHSQGAIPTPPWCTAPRWRSSGPSFRCDPGGDGRSGGESHPHDGGHAQLRTVHPRHRLSVEMAVPVHGRGEGVNFFSTLARDSNFARQLHSGIDPKTWTTTYLLDVDHPMVIPSGTKVRLLLTSEDVIHAWWVPDFGAKRSAVPGFVNELWFKVDPGKEGIYRGQCAALCGRDHGFMPIVVDVRTPDDFKKWVEEQKAALKQAAARATGADAAPPPTAQVCRPPTDHCNFLRESSSHHGLCPHE